MVVASGDENYSLIPIAHERRDEKKGLKQWWRVCLCGGQRRNIPKFVSLFTMIVSCIEQYPLEVQIIFLEETNAASVTIILESQSSFGQLNINLKYVRKGRLVLNNSQH